MRNDNKRISWIDMAKGYGIILVILAHLNIGKVGTWIYTFHMPLFFFLSGCVFNEKYDFLTFLLKKCRSIVVPYFALGIPMVIAQMAFFAYDGVLTKELFAWILKGFIVQTRMWSIWFIACLFCMNLLFYVLVKFIKKDWLIGLIAILMAVIGLKYYETGGREWFWSSDVCLTAIPFFYSGYCYKKYGKNIDKIL